MRSPGERLPGKKSKNSAVCWTNTKGTADDRSPDDQRHGQSHDLGFPEHHAIVGMVALALSLAGDRTSCPCRSGDGCVPASCRAVRDRIGCARTDVVFARGDLFLLFAAACKSGSIYDVVTARRG